MEALPELGSRFPGERHGGDLVHGGRARGHQRHHAVHQLRGLPGAGSRLHQEVGVEVLVDAAARARVGEGEGEDLGIAHPGNVAGSHLNRKALGYIFDLTGLATSVSRRTPPAVLPAPCLPAIATQSLEVERVRGNRIHRLRAESDNALSIRKGYPAPQPSRTVNNVVARAGHIDSSESSDYDVAFWSREDNRHHAPIARKWGKELRPPRYAGRFATPPGPEHTGYGCALLVPVYLHPREG
jgi:hypothetical protein